MAGANGLEPKPSPARYLTDVNRYNGDHARNVIPLEVELINN